MEIAKQVKPSDRGELEITDVNKSYLVKGQWIVEKVQKNVIWFESHIDNIFHEYEFQKFY